MNEEVSKIISVIDRVRPFLIDDGGNIEFIKYDDGIVYVKLIGACANCSLIDTTLKEGIEQFIINEVPSVKEVVNISE